MARPVHHHHLLLVTYPSPSNLTTPTHSLTTLHYKQHPPNPPNTAKPSSVVPVDRQPTQPNPTPLPGSPQLGSARLGTSPHLTTPYLGTYAIPSAHSLPHPVKSRFFHFMSLPIPSHHPTATMRRRSQSHPARAQPFSFP